LADVVNLIFSVGLCMEMYHIKLGLQQLRLVFQAEFGLRTCTVNIAITIGLSTCMVHKQDKLGLLICMVNIQDAVGLCMVWAMSGIYMTKVQHILVSFQVMMWGEEEWEMDPNLEALCSPGQWTLKPAT